MAKTLGLNMTDKNHPHPFSFFEAPKRDLRYERLTHELDEDDDRSKDELTQMRADIKNRKPGYLKKLVADIRANVNYDQHRLAEERKEETDGPSLFLQEDQKKQNASSFLEEESHPTLEGMDAWMREHEAATRHAEQEG